MLKKTCFLLLTLCLFAWLGTGSPVLAASRAEPLFAVSSENTSLHPGEPVSVTLTPQYKNLSAFILTAEYDSEIASVSAKFTNTSSNDHSYTSAEDGRITIVYAADEGAMPADSSLTLTFRTDSETTARSASILLSVTDAADVHASTLLQTPEVHRVDLSFSPKTSANASLLSLTPPVGQLSPSYDPNIYEYTLEVPFAYQSLEWDTIPAEGATVKVNRKNLGAGGSTTDFNFTVTAEDGKTKSVYTVHVTRLEKEDNPEQGDTALSTDCTLLVLSPPTGELSPTFDPNIYEYTLDVPFVYQSLEWDAIPAEGATVKVNRKNLGAGGSTTDFKFTVTAEDGKTKAVYTVHVTRLKKEESPDSDALSADCTLITLSPPTGELYPAFDPSIYEYTLEVPFAYQSLEWDAIPAEGATVKVNRKNLGAGGSTTDFKFTVTAEDGKTKAVYTVHVTRLKKDENPDSELPSAECTLIALTPPVGELSPTFDPNTYEYTLEVPFVYQSLEWDAIPAEGATVKVNRKNLGAGGSITDFFLTVTAADGKSKSIYTVHVKRLEKGSLSTQITTRPDSSSASNAEPDSQADAPADFSENSGSNLDLSQDTSETVIHVSAQNQKTDNDPFKTAALVLVSAAAGMVLVLGAQYVLQKKDDSKD